MSNGLFESAGVLLRSGDNWVLQQRDDIVGIAQPGAVGLWGGRKNDGETPTENALRELEEETGVILPPDRLERLAELSYSLGVKLPDGTTETRNISSTFFYGYQEEEDERVKSREGQALYLPLPELFLPGQWNGLPRTVELSVTIGHLVEMEHPAYLESVSVLTDSETGNDANHTEFDLLSNLQELVKEAIGDANEDPSSRTAEHHQLIDRLQGLVLHATTEANLELAAHPPQATAR